APPNASERLDQAGEDPQSAGHVSGLRIVASCFEVPISCGNEWAGRGLHAEKRVVTVELGKEPQDGHYKLEASCDMDWKGYGFSVNHFDHFSNYANFAPIGYDHSDHLKADPSKLHVFEWSDLDEEADALNKRRLNGEEVPAKELDALISQRKKVRLKEGLELFDDWLLRQAGSLKEGRRLEVVLEAHVPAREVELHEEPSCGPAPIPHSCIRSIELDSDEDSEDERDPDDGQGTYLDYLRRRCLESIPSLTHAMDPRELGDDDHEDLRDAFQALLTKPLPPDPELMELEKTGAKAAQEEEEVAGVPSRKARRASRRPQPVPSWEAYFGATAELLYYSRHVKADFVPFLMGCLAPSTNAAAGGPQALKDFFGALFFDTVPAALQRLNLEGERRSMMCVRSLTYDQDGKLLRRPADGGLIPVRSAPLERYLKATSTNPPRTWISGLAESLRQRGAAELVQAAQDWYLSAVSHLLEDPKSADDDGDYFLAWLRECCREVYDDVDRNDPKELRTMKKVRSVKNKTKRHNLADIRIPSMEEAFRELAEFEPQSGSSRRQRVLAKIVIDAFQLRLVDLAAILRVADCVLSAREDEEVVVVLYAGGAHAHCVEEFWRAQSFTSDDLPKRGLVGKDDWDDDEPRGLVLPKYLHDFDLLFPQDSGEAHAPDEAMLEGADEEAKAREPELGFMEGVYVMEKMALSTTRKGVLVVMVMMLILIMAVVVMHNDDGGHDDDNKDAAADDDGDDESESRNI
ncbi:unnamed protein product, partial [Symbiodinium sp. KB8]